MKGRLSEISTVGLIKMFHEGRQSGRLVLTASDGGAELYFVDGALVTLDVDGPRSADGPYDIFRWRAGEFEFDLGVEPPARNVELSLDSFLDEGADYERRWQSLANISLGTLTYLRPAQAPPADVELGREEEEALAALRRAGEGLPLISLTKRFDLGFLDTAEMAKRLYDRGLVDFESPAARHLGGAVQDVLTGILRNYEIFAGKVLTKKLAAHVIEFGRHSGLPLSYDGRHFTVGAAAKDEDNLGQWRALFGLVVSEMAGPLGAEVARLLWEKTLTSAEPATAGVISRYGLDVVRWEKVGNTAESR
jgi:hypothetical protein